MISGNVNSYTRILNGPQQLERIKNFNDLAASISALQREKDEIDQKAREENKKKKAEQEERRAERDQKEKEEFDRLAPECKVAVERGLDHVLSLTVPVKKQILKIHFGQTGVAKLNKKDADAELRKVMGAMPVDENRNDDSNVEVEGDANADNESLPLPLPDLPAATDEASIANEESVNNCA